MAAKTLLGCLAQAAMEQPDLSNDDFASKILPQIARDAWPEWAEGKSPSQLRRELEEVAGLSEDEAAGQAQPMGMAEAARAGAALAFVRQVPAVLRASQRRPEDVLGRTVTPALPVSRWEHLAALLPQRASSRFQKGDNVPGQPDWVLDELLGVGGFGEVWKAINPDVPLPPRAVKFCLSESAKTSLRNEASLLGRVRVEAADPGIVRLLNTALRHDPPYLEYEFVAGGELTALIRTWLPAERQQRATRMIRDIAGIVATAHRLEPPIVHRDLKPANVLITADGSPRITDFGIGGVAMPQGGHTTATILSGAHTPLYASRQQRDGEKADPTDDVHALGVMWLHLLTGDLTLEAGHAREILEEMDAPEPILSLLTACVSLRRERRPLDAGVLLDLLTPLVEERKGTPAPPPPTPVSVVVPIEVAPPPKPKAPPPEPEPLVRQSPLLQPKAGDLCTLVIPSCCEGAAPPGGLPRLLTLVIPPLVSPSPPPGFSREVTLTWEPAK